MKHYNIPVFVPHRGCPNDCVFCNQKHITGIIKDLCEQEIREIVDEHLKTIPDGAHKEIAFFGGSFTGIDMELQRKYLSVAYEYIKKGVVIFCDDTERFAAQVLPKTVFGVCEEDSAAALMVFKNSGVAVISCGLGSKNTVTVSSISKNQMLIAFQRSFINIKGEVIEPREYRINLNKSYNTYSVLAAATALILNSIIPESI